MWKKFHIILTKTYNSYILFLGDKMKKYKYNIVNLDCANCAREIEEALNKNEYLNNVVVNFNTLTLSYESEKEFSLKELNALVKKIEPDISITSNEIAVKKEFHLSILILGIIIGALGLYLNIPQNLKIILYIVSYSLLLYKTSINAIKLLIKSKTINENALITISCLGALIIGNVMEGIMVITLYTIGKILEEKALNNSRKSIKNLLDISEAYANKKEGNNIIKIDVNDVKVNDILVVKKGEKIPVDGIIVEGSTILDTSSLTGESKPTPKNINDTVLSGCINLEDVIQIKATSVFKDSTVSKIIELLESATDKKTKTETVVSKISKIYTPIVLILAVLIVATLPILFKVSINDSIYRGLTFLVISCPCAIAISVPLSYFTGIGTSSKNGILIKGSNYLDNLSNTKNIIFDKTGTLTNGSYEVTNIELIDKTYTKEEIMDILLKGESLSSHPIASSIVKNKKINNIDITNFKEIKGQGISFKLNDKLVLIGNKTLCNCHEESILHLNINGTHVASITISDTIKENAHDTIKSLKKLGITTYMFTGDNKDTALTIGNQLGIDNIKYEMLPTDKYKNYELVSHNNGITIFVGDGINDAPVLKRADIGISMGGVGSDEAIEASDIVLMKDDLKRIIDAIKISNYTKHIIKENLIFASLTKIVILLLSVFGLANMWFAVFADTGVTLLTILNTLRIMNSKTYLNK